VSFETPSLDSVLCTAELASRPRRPANYEAENLALKNLSKALAESPESILQALTDTIRDLLDAGSAGVSLLIEEENRFYWPAISGVWTSHVGSGTPRDFGPCGVVLDRNAPQLLRDIETYYDYLQGISPPVEEVLLVPFYVSGKAVGTVWAVSHDHSHAFDQEDLRQLESLAIFASSAFQCVKALEKLSQQQNALRERDEALQLADRNKDEFLATLAHELRNPIAPISNGIQVLQLSETQDEDVRATTSMMERQIKQVIRLIDDLLDVSRISRGKIHLSRERTAVAEVIQHTVEAARVECDGKGIALTVELPDEPLYVYADPLRLPQVVGNIINNACKFTERGGKIHVAVGSDETDVIIRITDTGMGIHADQLEEIFGMFRQVDKSREKTQSGLGIGLALVKKLVELHSGNVAVRSEGLGLGSEFTLRIPSLRSTEPIQ
jgi:signal transduction histidine kinase